jgi:hypothetical protein
MFRNLTKLPLRKSQLGLESLRSGDELITIRFVYNVKLFF